MVWSERMRAARRRLANSDYSGIELLLGCFGGMGSFNDLIVGQSSVDGTFIWKDGAAEANERLAALRDRAAQLTHEIRDDCIQS